MKWPTTRYKSVIALGLVTVPLTALLFLAGGRVEAQAPPEFNEITIQPRLHEQDTGDIWTMHFRFKPPRVITAEVPGRGKKIIWYMWYQVINRTGEPRTFIPELELKTDDRFTVHMDEVLPSVQKQISLIEDPTGRLNIKNSVTMSKNPILPSKPDAAPRAVTGVAIWSDVYDKAPDTNYFKIFVSGLSNGWSEDENGVIRRKTLQLDFRRYNDGTSPARPTDIRFVNDGKWIYRASASDLKGEAEEAPAPKDEQ